MFIHQQNVLPKINKVNSTRTNKCANLVSWQHLKKTKSGILFSLTKKTWRVSLLANQ